MTTLIPKYDIGAAGAVNRPINFKLAEIVSVKDFGAIGDGVADDTVAIQAAVNFASSNSFGGNVIFPSGIYKVTATINVIASLVSLTGESRDSVQIIRTTAYGPIVIFSTTTASVLDGTGISNIRLIDNGTNNATGTAVQVENASRFTMQNVTIFGGTNGIILKGAANVDISNVQMYMQNSLGSPTGRYGIQLTNTAIPSAAVVFGSNVHLTNIDIYGGDQYSALYSNLDDCIRVECVDGLWLSNVYAGGAAVADLHLYRTNAMYPCGNIFSSKTMLDICRGNGILIDGTQYVTKVLFDGIISCSGIGVVNKDGIYTSGPIDSIKFTGTVFGWKGNGIHIGNSGGTAATNINISSMIIGANTGYGIQIETNTGTDFLMIKGNNVGNNTAGTINDLTAVSTTTKDLEGNLSYNTPWIAYTPTIACAKALEPVFPMITEFITQ